MSPLYRDDTSSIASDDDFEHIKQTTLDDIALSTPEPASPCNESESPREIAELSPSPIEDPGLQIVEFDYECADPSLLGFLGELVETTVQIASSTRYNVRRLASKCVSGINETVIRHPRTVRGSLSDRRRALLVTHFLHGYIAFVLVACVAMVYMHVGRLVERRTCMAAAYGEGLIPKATNYGQAEGSRLDEAVSSPIVPPTISAVTPESPCLVSWKPLDGKSHSQKFMCGGVKYYMTLNANVKEDGKAPRLAAFLSTASDSIASQVDFTLSFIGRKGSKGECDKRLCRSDGRLLWKNRFSSKLVPAGGVGTAPISRVDALRDMRSGGTFYLEVSIDKVTLM